MTKLPEDEQTDPGHTDNMEQSEANVTGEYTISNGDVGQSNKHDDFFDETPAKQPESSSYTEKSEHEASNGDVEKENAESVAVEEGESEKKEENDEEKKEEADTEEKEGDDAGKDVEDEAKTDVPAETAESHEEEGSTNQTNETAEQREVTETSDATDPAAGSTAGPENAGEAQAVSPDQDAQTDTLHVEGREGRVASSESMYEDDFSQHSDAAASVTTPTTKDTGAATTDLNASTDFEEANSITAEEKKEEDPLPVETPPKTPEPEHQVVEEGQEGDTNRPDSRAEAGAVVPVPVIVPDTEEPKRDGRSSAGGEEMGEYRGEDRKEEVAPEGSEDCRGQGQWRPAEHQAMESAILAQRTDKEALDEVTAERDQLLKEYESLKGDSEKSIKDLQERLAILARENEEKDKRIFRLESDLQEVTSKLRESERKLFAAETSAAGGNSEAAKSKTCIIM